MGGTSFDVALIEGGRPQIRHLTTLEYGVPIAVPTVDLVTIGAGGGSIARVDGRGLLRVGPESAGAAPGPIWFGRGGTLPTVTDANHILGRIPVDHAIGSTSPVSADTVRREFLGGLAGAFDDPMTAAEAVVRIANAEMGGAIRKVTLEQGKDPRDFALFSFGGAGGLHLCALAEELETDRGLVPPYPGLMSAMGCLLADVRHDVTSSVDTRVGVLQAEYVRGVLEAHTAELTQFLDRHDALRDTLRIGHVAEMQYEGQSHMVHVPISASDLEGDRGLEVAFEMVYADEYGRLVPNCAIRVGAIRSFATAEPQGSSAVLAMLPRALPQDTVALGTTQLWTNGSWTSCPVFGRGRELAGAGPALVVQDDATTFVAPGWSYRTDAFCNLILERR
jgi:N-methylhydantoinase A